MISKPLNLILSMLLLSLSISLVTFVLQLSDQMGGQLEKNITPFDMVVGAKGSPLQLVLASVLHIDNPTGNIKLKEARPLMNHPFVEYAIPVSYGDNYKGFRILGTTPEYIRTYEGELAEGKFFNRPFELVVGAGVAEKLGLQLGNEVIGNHGLIETDFGAHDDHPYVVTGILKRSNSVLDQLLITSLESVWDSHAHEGEGSNSSEEEHDHEEGHDHKEGHEHDDHDHEAEHAQEHGDDHDHDHDHGDDHDGEHAHQHGDDHDHDHAENDADREITSLLIRFGSPLGMVQLPRYINESTNMQSALPSFEVQRLLGLLGSGVKTVNGIALAILLVSALSIFISLLKTIRERKRELALLRVYGFRTGQLLYLALMEGLFLSLLGFVVGWGIGRLGIAFFSSYTENEYGYSLLIQPPNQQEYILLGITLCLSIVAAFLAALPVFNLNVAKTLTDE
jgi:putative ABC transport system permease protein